MVGLGYALLDLLGSSTAASGLACSATSPASLNVTVAPGRIYSLQNVDNTAFSTLPADTSHQIVKQGILANAVTLACPAPSTPGFSVNYLIEATYQDFDALPVVLPFYNGANPTQPFSGPANSGATSNTVRQGLCVVQAKAGIPAATGTQVTPSPDAGYVGLWVVTVAFGATSIGSSNISQSSGAPFVAAPLGQFLAPYAITAAEITAGVIPTNLAYRPGSLQRYGADPTGAADSSAAITNACACNSLVFDEYPGGGRYLCNNSVTLSSVTKIRGTQKQGFGSSLGTTFVCGTAIGANGALFHATAFIEDLDFADFSVTWQTFNTSQVGFLFDLDCRSARWRNIGFVGLSNASTNVTGIKFSGGGTFTGDVTIRECYVTGLWTGISLNGTCSTVRILDNELYTNVTTAGTVGINDQSVTGGALIEGNTFQGWNVGILVGFGSVRQRCNYFEGQTTYDFDWGATTNNVSIADYSTGTPQKRYAPPNNSTGNVVLFGSYGSFIDGNAIQAYRGYIEQGRPTANGHFSAIPYLAGNFGGQWAPNAGQVTLEQYALTGNICHLDLQVSGATITATGTALTFTMPVTASQIRYFPVWITTGAGTRQIGVAVTAANSATLSIYVDATFATNWPTGASGAVSISIDFQVNASVN